MKGRILFGQSLDFGPAAVGAAVVNDEDFLAEAVLLHHPVYPGDELRKRLPFVVGRYDYGNIHYCWFSKGLLEGMFLDRMADTIVP